MFSKVKIASCAMCLLGASAVQAQMFAEKSSSERVGVTAEVKPIPTLLSLVPGVGSAAIGVEGDVNRDIGETVYGEVSTLSSNLPSRFDGTAHDKAPDKLYPNKTKGAAVDIGTRFYSSLDGHGWYTGAKIGYNQASTEWMYKNEIVDSTYAALTPGIAAGYRWLWTNSLVLRLGGSLSANLVQTNRTESKQTTNGEDKQKADDDIKKGQNTPILAGLDLGLGYKF